MGALPALPSRTFLQRTSAALAAGFPPGSLILGRNVRTKNTFALMQEDMQGHMHIIGASGKGKSNFIEVLQRQHILAADGVPRGMCSLSPHGFGSHLDWIAENRVADYRTIRVIDASDPEHTFGFNPFAQADHFDKATLAENMAKATMQAWGADRLTDTPRLNTVLTETYYALAVNRATLLEATDLLRAEDPNGLRRHFVENLPNEVSQSFWEDLAGASPARRHEILESTWSRLRPFLRTPAVRRIFGATERTIDLAAAMDAGEILLINLRPSEHLSAEAARLIGTFLVTAFYTACFRRKNPKLPFYLFIDEAQLFLTPDIARILDQSRKFGLFLCLAHQHLGHLREAGEAIMRSVLTNCRVRAVFGGLEPEDAKYLARTVFRGQWDYERPKRNFVQPMVVGVRRTIMANGSASFGVSHSVGDSTGTSGSTAESQTVTHSRSTTISDSESDSTSETASPSSPGTRTVGRSTTHGTAVSDGTSVADGTTETRGWSRGRTVTAGTSLQASRGFSEAFEPIYALRPNQLYSLEEQIQQRADALARLPVGQMWLQIDTKRPRRIAVAYLGERYILPALAERVRHTLIALTPYMRPAAAAEAVYRAYRERLVAAAKRVVEQPEEANDFSNIAAKLRGKDDADAAS